MEEIIKKADILQLEETELKRDISLFGGVGILAGIMIGSGIFYIGSYVLIRTGMNLGMTLLVWILGGIITMLSGICYAEVGAMMPKAGGQYVYLREAFGERLAFMSGFSAFILGNSGSIAALAVAFAMGIGNYINVSPLGVKAIAIGVIVALTLVNIAGVKLGSMVQNIFFVGKIVPIVLIMGLGLILGKQSPDLSLIPAAGAEVSMITMVSMVAYAIVATLWAYEGWTNLNTISEEIKNPKKNIPLAIIISISAVTVLYTVFNYAIYKVLNPEEISMCIEAGNYYIGTESARVLMGNFGMVVVSIGMVIAIFGSLNGCIMVFPRAYYAMAQDGLFFKSFKKVHKKYKTPYNALIGSMIISIILVCMRDLDQLTLLVIFSGTIFNALTFLSVLVLRKKYPDLERPYKVWGGKITIIITTLIMVGLSINALIEDPVTSALGLIIPCAGFIIYEIIYKRAKVR